MEQIVTWLDDPGNTAPTFDLRQKPIRLHVLVKGDGFIKTGCIEQINGNEMVFGYASLNGPKSGKYLLEIFTSDQQVIMSDVFSEIFCDYEFSDSCRYTKTTIGKCYVRLLELTETQMRCLDRLSRLKAESNDPEVGKSGWVSV